MKASNLFGLGIFIALTFTPLPQVLAQTDSLTFEEAIVKGLIEYEAHAPKTDRGLELNIESRTDRALLIRIAPGGVFTCEGNYQPQVITRDKEILVMAREHRKVGLSASCGNAVAASPPLSHPFTFSHYLETDAQRILTELSDARLDDLNIVRNVVWMFTNDRPISDLHPRGMDEDTYDFVMKTVREAHGPEFVDTGYRVRYREVDEGRRFSGIPEELMGKVEVDLRNEEAVAIIMAGEDGRVLRTGAVHFPPFNGLEKLGFDMDVRGVEAGHYVVQVTSLSDPSSILGSLEVEL